MIYSHNNWYIKRGQARIGELTGSIQYWDRQKIAKRTDWYRFYRIASKKDEKFGEIERFIVIKEALGNFFLSLLFGGTVAVLLVIDNGKIKNLWIFILCLSCFFIIIILRHVSIYIIENKKNAKKSKLFLKLSFLLEDILYVILVLWLILTKPWICEFNKNAPLILSLYVIFLVSSHYMHLIHVERQTQWVSDLNE